MRKLLILTLCLSACAHRRPVLPDVNDVRVAREPAPAKCRELGALEGRVGSAKGTREEALADLKREAADRGANYVRVDTWSAFGTAVTGVGYVCP